MKTPASLADLRREIDEIDHKLLELMGDRNRVVERVAALKRARSIPIYDKAREQELLADRRAAALSLGLPETAIESVFRLILNISRDQQTALRAGLRPSAEPKTVAIVGGEGSMGRCMAQLFSTLGHRILIADLKTALSSEEAAARADVVLVSVPIGVTEEVIDQVGPHVRPDALLMDITSVKSGPMAAMLAATTASVVGTHPMFGPGVHSFQQQRIVVCPGRGDQWLAWIREMFQAQGLIVVEVSPGDHDRLMAIVQVLNHFRTQVTGLTMSRLGHSLAQSKQVSSPVYLMELYMVARHFAQDPELYGPIEMLNPETERVTRAFVDIAIEIAQVLRDKDQTRFNAIFAEVRRSMGPFTEEALEQTSHVVDRLVERS
jgi:chorismate mutase/prephenate dehydrogenase